MYIYWKTVANRVTEKMLVRSGITSEAMEWVQCQKNKYSLDYLYFKKKKLSWIYAWNDK